MKGRRKFSLVAVMAFLMTGLLGGFVISELSHPMAPIHQVSAFAADQTAYPVSDQALEVQSQFSAAVRQATPAVVSIVSSRIVKVNQQIPNDPFFRRFFGDMFPQFQSPPQQKEEGLGSGVVISHDGYIVTNSHVVEGAQDVEVISSDKQKYTAKVIGADPRTDLAILKIEAQGLPTLKIGGSSDLNIGEIVFAIGNPFGVGQTVTMGIVSATGRGNLGIEDYEDFIQTDAAINPGNSGGALINLRGELVGINTAIIGRSGGNNGIGFAIPAKMVKHVASQLRQFGKVTRGYIGAYIQEVTPEIASAFELDTNTGALISDLDAEGPAAQAGLHRGDVVVALDGQPVSDARRLRLEIASKAPGTTVNLTVIRQGEEISLPIKLGKLQEEQSQQESGPETEGDSLRGLNLQELTPDIRNSLGLDRTVQGAIVSGVIPGSPAQEAGLQRGDVIQEVARQPVTNIDDCQRLFSEHQGQDMLLLVNRGGNTLYLVLRGS